MSDRLPARIPSAVYPPVPPHFRAVRVMGQGSTAVTWLAQYEVTGQDVALKVWRSPFRRPAARERFVNECRWHRLLNGEPGIVGWVWASEPDLEHPWTATQPHGLTLTEYLRRHRITTRKAMRLGLDLLEGLASVHRRGLVHRDVNPNNVLVDDTGAVLCDFGLAMPVDRVTADRAAGTPGFVAPELGADAPDFRSDVYSAAQTIARLLGPEVPAPVDHLVTAVAGSSRPSDRPVDAMDFATRLREVFDGAGWTSSTTRGPVTVSAYPPPGDTLTPDDALTPGDTLTPDDALTPGGTRQPRGRRWAPWAAGLLVLGTAATGVALGSQVFDADRSAGSRTSSSDTAGPAATGATSGHTRTSTATPAAPTPGTTAPGSAASGTTAPGAAASGATPSAVAGLFPSPDIGENGQPVQGPQRPASRCDGTLREAVDLLGADGAVVGTVKVFREAGTALCAKFVKAHGPIWDVRTYLALTVCNTKGSCDNDWNLYKMDAGPVRVNAPTGCLHWRVSATDVDGTTWLLRDRTGSSGC